MACVLGAALVLVVLAPGVGYGAVTASRAEVNGGPAHSGHGAANRTITVDGVATGTSDGAGRFRVERAGFTAPADCTVAVNDGSATAATFTVTTNPVANSQSATIIGTVGRATRSATLTITAEFQATDGSVSLAREGTGGGRVTSQPAGIDYTFTATETTGTCGNAFSRPVPRSGWRPVLPKARAFWAGSSRPPAGMLPRSRWAAGVAHICRPVFRVK